MHDSYLDALRAVAVSYSNYEARQASDPFGMAIKIGGLAKTTSAEVDAKFDNADTELRTLRAKYPDLPQFTIGGDPPAAGSLLDQPQTPNR